MIFALVVAISTSLLYLITYIPVLKDVVSIKSQVQLVVFNNGKGSALSSLLASETDGITYEEILGSMAAKGFPEGRDAEMLEIIKSMEGGLEVKHGDTTIKTYEQTGVLTRSADIALPGLRKGEVIVS